jgi:CRP-like cAMP-binding protein
MSGDGTGAQRIAALLKRFKSLSGFSADELQALAGVLRLRRLSSGDVLFREGAPADGCYLIADGRVRVTVDRPTGAEQLALLGRGDLVGQMALLDGGKRSATCTAADPSVVLFMGRDEFDLVFRSGSSFALKFVDVLTHMLVSQLRYANRRLAAQAEQRERRSRPTPGEQSDEEFLKEVASITFSGSLDVDIDEVEVVVPEGLRRDHSRS